MRKAGQALLKEVGTRVRLRRQQRALTIKQLAAESDLSERFVSELEAGRANISVVNLLQVASALEVPLTQLFASPAGAQQPSDGVIALLGLRGAGKSTVGRALAQQLGVGFWELDRLVEVEAGMGLPEIFAIHGESYFRQVEHRALARFLDTHSKGVLATGGGLVDSPETFALIRERTHSVWLKASPDEHWERVVEQGDLRPMQNRPQAMVELKRRLKEREPLYARAERTCVTSARGVGDVVSELSRWARAGAR
jgi:XRE family transcriptional regulator, aerobic/anaerobic benzoate catabolism transcriptional regulator